MAKAEGPWVGLWIVGGHPTRRRPGSKHAYIYYFF